MGTAPAVSILSLDDLVLSGSHGRPLAVQSLVDRMDISWDNSRGTRSREAIW